MPNNYILLETIALTQSAASVTFDNLPTSGYTDLKIVMSARRSAGNFPNPLIQFNNDTASNYRWRGLYGDGASAASNNSTSATSILFGVMTGSSETANTFGSGEAYIPNYLSNSQKSVSIEALGETNASTAYMYMVAGLWTGTAAITSIKVLPGNADPFIAGSTFSLYGIAALGTTPVLVPKATGGNIVANDGTYWYHAFTSSGNFVPQVGLTCDYLVVAGGGAGGGTDGGGGGAGGFRYLTSQSLSSLTPITVGGGGTGAGAYSQGTNGINSSVGAISATGGGKGAGGSGPQTFGTAGGSGGGGAGNTSGGSNSYPGGAGNAGSYSPVEGFAGGVGKPTESPRRGAGGGGAGGVGVNGDSTSNGGVGSNILSSWATVTSTGVSGYYAGGGGGGVNGGSAGAGGAGGGSAGAIGAASGNATANTGGGSGGGGNDSGSGNGGSGIVIIRYPIN